MGKSTDATDGNSFVKNTKIILPLKYLSNFWRSLEMPLINFKIHLELNWIVNNNILFKKSKSIWAMPFSVLINIIT